MDYNHISDYTLRTTLRGLDESLRKGRGTVGASVTDLEAMGEGDLADRLAYAREIIEEVVHDFKVMYGEINSEL